MDFNFSEEQNLLRDSVTKFVADQYEWEARRERVASDEWFSASNYAQMAELGWTYIPFTEEQGGIGDNIFDALVVMEEFGKGLVVEPFLENAILCGGMVSLMGANPDDIEAIMAGEQQYALAYTELGIGYNNQFISCAAEQLGDAYSLTGAKAVVLNGAAADKLLVVARSSGTAGDEAGLSLFMVDAADASVERKGYKTVDGMNAAEVRFNATPAQLVGEAGAAFAPLSRVLDKGAMMVMAEGLGVMQTLLAKTVEYTKTRKQFGMPIAAFQVLQHRMVDMFIEVEQSRSILYRAALHFDKDNSAKEVSAAKAQFAKALRYVGQQAVQLHGGMGVTDELDVGHYFKRTTSINTLFGNGDWHRRRFASL